nr:MAG TPA: Cell Wall Hydrolase [Caudoviricetes sp.]
MDTVLSVKTLPVLFLLLLFGAIMCWALTESTSEKAITYIAEVLYCEAGGESALGVHAVATTMINRSKLSHRSVYDVCRKPRAYYHRSLSDAEKRSIAYRVCKHYAKEAAYGRLRPLDDWTHYYNPSKANPAWSKLLRNTKTIGAHRFGTLDYK